MTAVATTVKRALAIYGTTAFAEMIKNCMAQELSWKVAQEFLSFFTVDSSCKHDLYTQFLNLVNFVGIHWRRDLQRSGRRCC